MLGLLTISAVGLFTRNNKHAKTLGLTTVCEALWILVVILFLLNTNQQNSLVLANIFYVIAISIPIFIIIFADSYSQVKRLKFLKIALLFMLVLFAILLTIQPNTIIANIDIVSIYDRRVAFNFANYVAYCLVFIISFSFGAALLLKNSLSKKLQRKQQLDLKITVCLAVVGGTIGAIFNLLLPLLGNYNLIWVGPIGAAVFLPIAYRLATTNEHFSALKTFARGFIYCIIGTLIIAGCLLALTIMARIIGPGYDVNWNHYVVGVTVLLISLIWIYILRAFGKVIIKNLDFDGYNENEVLSRISQIIASKHDPADFLKAVRHTLKELFGVDQVDVIVFGHDTAAHLKDSALEKTLLRLTTGNKPRSIYCNEVKNHIDLTTLKAHDIEVVTPIVGAIDGKANGVIVLSPRKRRFERHYGETLDRVAAIISSSVQSVAFHKQLMGYNDRLKADVARKTKKLQESNKELQEADMRRSEAMTISSHNLRTPLTGMIGIVDMMLSGEFGKISKEQRKMLEMAAQSGQAMNQVISSVMDASNIDSGNFVLNKTDFDLSAIVDEVVNLLTEKTKQKGMELAYNRDKRNIWMNGDIARIKQAIVNIIDNAIYYGKSKVEVSLHKTDGHVVFLVKDDGIGVPKADQPKLFGKMFRASNSGAVRPDGTGIGLYVVKKTVEESGGKMIFESIEGEGSLFGFEI
ncbi:HAMP domain-containing histidine kinase [Candidatus Saccharibacteria bacterium]|nr:HAMP domain-containing histidine kinase [Candidatus Saccharibacteria bacterium]